MTLPAGKSALLNAERLAAPADLPSNILHEGPPSVQSQERGWFAPELRVNCDK